MNGIRKRLLPLLLIAAVVFSFRAVPAAAATLTFPGKLKTIAAEAFYGDSSFDTAVLQEGVTRIGSRAFAESSLREITLPSSLTYIADDAFDGSALKTVHVEKGTYAYRWMRDNGYIAEYRALLIGEQSFLWFYDDKDPESGCWLDDMDQRNVGDVRNLSAALGNTVGPRGVYGPEGDQFKVTRKTNLTYSEIRRAIRTAFADTRDQDISVFFIATHGNSKGDGDLRTAFNGDMYEPSDVSSYWSNRYLSFSTLASWLKAYTKGRLFIILQSCGSGSSIYSGNSAAAAATLRDADSAANAERFVARAVETFSRADPGVPALPDDSEGVLRNSAGDLRQPRFYVLAASKHHEDNYGWETEEAETSYNYFTKWLIKGIGRKNASPADSDGNNILNLSELYAYLQQYDSYPFVIGSQTYYQHVRCYPDNNLCKLLKLAK